ncbi:hypothetical protein U1Q18_011072 [Sarracenia purpurea var. burkii]
MVNIAASIQKQGSIFRYIVGEALQKLLQLQTKKRWVFITSIKAWFVKIMIASSHLHQECQSVRIKLELLKSFLKRRSLFIFKKSSGVIGMMRLWECIYLNKKVRAEIMFGDIGNDHLVCKKAEDASDSVSCISSSTDSKGDKSVVSSVDADHAYRQSFSLPLADDENCKEVNEVSFDDVKDLL